MGQVETAINLREPSTQSLGNFLRALSAITPRTGVPAKIGEMAIKQTARYVKTDLVNPQASLGSSTLLAPLNSQIKLTSPRLSL